MEKKLDVSPTNYFREFMWNGYNAVLTELPKATMFRLRTFEDLKSKIIHRNYSYMESWRQMVLFISYIAKKDETTQEENVSKIGNGEGRKQEYHPFKI